MLHALVQQVFTITGFEVAAMARFLSYSMVLFMDSSLPLTFVLLLNIILIGSPSLWWRLG